MCRYKVLLSSDAAEFGGHDRIDIKCEYFAEDKPWHERMFSMLVS